MIRKNKSGFRNKQSRSKKARRSKFFSGDRSLRFETMEGRLVLSSSGFAGNEFAPVLDENVLGGIVPMATDVFSPQTLITFEFSAAAVVTDEGVGATLPADINFTLDPDIEDQFRNNGSTPIGATLTQTLDPNDDVWVFNWTPTQMQQGAYNLRIIATDAGGVNNESLSDAFSFTLRIDDRPIVDLDGGAQDNVDFTSTFVEDGGPVAIVDSANLSIPFVANDQVASATVQISPLTLQADGLETLSVTTSGSVVVDPSSTADTLVLTVSGGGMVDKSEFEAVLRTLTYDNTSNNPIAQQTIDVTINDGTSNSGIAVATVNITASNDRPNLLQIETPPDARVGQLYTLDLVAEDPDDGEMLIFQLNEFPVGAVIQPNAGGFAGTNTVQVARDPDGRFRATIEWTPTAGQGDENGKVLFTVLVNDTGQRSDSEDYMVTIVNTPPTANDDPETSGEGFFVSENDGDTDVGNVIANDTDPEDDDIVVDTATGAGAAVGASVEFTTAEGALVTVAADGAVNYNPNGMFESLGMFDENDPLTFTTDTFTYTLIDAKGGVSDPATVTVTIRGVNDAPEKVSPEVIPEFTIAENAGVTPLALAELQAAVTDVDDDVASLTVAELPTDLGNGSEFTLNDGVLSFNPNGAYDALTPDATEEIPVEVQLQDSSGGMVTINVKIIIEGVNNGPTVQSRSFDIGEDETLSRISRGTGLLQSATDDGDDALIEVAEVNGMTDMFGQAIELIDANGRRGNLTVSTDGTFSFVPGSDFDALATDQPSTVTFTYKAKDGATPPALSNEATVTINITGVNDAPTAGPVSAAAVEDGDPVTGNFAGADVDDPDASLTYEIVPLSLGDNGSVVLGPNPGEFTYDPGSDFQELAADEFLDVTFNYKAIDAAMAMSEEATVTVRVMGDNDAPEFNLGALATSLPTELQATNNGNTSVSLTLTVGAQQGNSLMVDLSQFTSDIDGDTVSFSRLEIANPDPAFRAENRPSFPSPGVLSWTPEGSDAVAGQYVIRVLATDEFNLTSSFDILVTVLGE